MAVVSRRREEERIIEETHACAGYDVIYRMRHGIFIVSRGSDVSSRKVVDEYVDIYRSEKSLSLHVDRHTYDDAAPEYGVLHSQPVPDKIFSRLQDLPPVVRSILCKHQRRYETWLEEQKKLAARKLTQ